MDAFDVADINLDSITIGGAAFPVKTPTIEGKTAPVDGDECDCHVAGDEGFDDLIVHFSRRDVILALGLDTLIGETDVEITVEGQLLSGQPFEGTDCVDLVGRD